MSKRVCQRRDIFNYLAADNTLFRDWRFIYDTALCNIEETHFSSNSEDLVSELIENLE